MTIELYVFPPSPRAFKVMAVANHLGLDYEIHFIDLRKGDQKTPQYAALNPNMRMPTLKEGDYVLWESSAIAQYLAKPVVPGINEPDMIAIAKGTEAFHRVAKVLDGHLKNKRFVTGDTLTLADFGIGSAMILAERAHYPVEPYGEIKRWYATLRALPAWQKTLGQSAPPAEAAA